jgi:enamine deaminase RidA (YjgF/YER057c/UK114 family)
MKIEAIHPATVSTAAPFYSPAVRAEGRQLLFISGQGPRDLGADLETQYRQAFEQIQTLVTAAGGTMRNVAMLRAYFLNMARDLATFRKVRQEFLVAPYPASTAVGVTELAVPGLEFEIEAVAML